jgi:hypothetical protein
MVGAFAFDFGSGGITFVLGTHLPRLQAWKRFIRELYGEPLFDMLPVVSNRETSEVIQHRANQYVQQEWANLSRQLIERVQHAREKHADTPEKYERAVERIQRNASRQVDELLSETDAINDILEEDLRIFRAPKPELLNELKARVTDPRLRAMFATRGVFEDDDDHEQHAPPELVVATPSSATAAVPGVARRFNGLEVD